MNKVAVYGREFGEGYREGVQRFFDKLSELSVEIVIHEGFREFLGPLVALPKNATTFKWGDSFDSSYDMVFSVGGDGTLLDTTVLVKDSGIPVVGVNTGRLGFLSSITLENIEYTLDQIHQGAFMLEQRSLLKLESETRLFGEGNFALNEITIHKKDTAAMVVIHAYVDGKFLNSYWADGLIIATPTGSTAYSLSCGGPIILPNSANFVITPVSPHNLNVRPVLISDQSVITLKVEGRSHQFLVSLDSRSQAIEENTVLTVMKNNFSLNLLRLKNHSFLKTLRNKLHWGLDKRN